MSGGAGAKDKVVLPEDRIHAGFGSCYRPGQKIEVDEPGQVVNMLADPQADAIDELAHLCEYWTKHRLNGRTPGHIKKAILMIAGELER